MLNAELARILRSIAAYLEMKEENVFKIRAYENAANSIESMAEDIGDVYKKGGLAALEKIPGVGKAIAEKIEEFIKTGKIGYHQKLKKQIPVDIEQLSAVEGMGPKKMLFLYKKLKIKNMKDLERAAKQGKIHSLPGFGEKTEKNILKSIGFAKKTSGRFTLGDVLPIAKEIEVYLKKQKAVRSVVVAGSIRRRKETIGDIDILVISSFPHEAVNAFVKIPYVGKIYGKGKTKSTVKLKNGLDVDLRVIPEKSFGSAMNYFTGSKAHNIALRKIALSKKLKLNEYGLFRGTKQIAGKTEEELYKKLGLRYIEPELRENAGEIEASKKNKLPKLIGYKDLKGDLQMHTNWTDGTQTIEEMALAAKNLDLEYIAITDHTKSLAMTGGLDEKKLEKQGKEIDNANKKIRGIAILKSAEVNILKDGSLDIKDSALKKLDVVGAAVHSNFNMPKQDMTSRIIKAMENPHVDILLHPTGRIIKRREAYAIDIEKIIDMAKSTGTVLEIDSYPERLDLKDEHARLAVKKHVKIAIDSDAHSTDHLQLLEFGIAQARRGWAQKKDVINAWPLKKMKKMLK